MADLYDVVIVGGGAAGLSAAIVLGGGEGGGGGEEGEGEGEEERGEEGRGGGGGREGGEGEAVARPNSKSSEVVQMKTRFFATVSAAALSVALGLASAYAQAPDGGQQGGAPSAPAAQPSSPSGMTGGGDRPAGMSKGEGDASGAAPPQQLGQAVNRWESGQQSLTMPLRAATARQEARIVSLTASPLSGTVETIATLKTATRIASPLN